MTLEQAKKIIIKALKDNAEKGNLSQDECNNAIECINNLK